MLGRVAGIQVEMSHRLPILFCHEGRENVSVSVCWPSPLRARGWSVRLGNRGTPRDQINNSRVISDVRRTVRSRKIQGRQ